MTDNNDNIKVILNTTIDNNSSEDEKTINITKINNISIKFTLELHSFLEYLELSIYKYSRIFKIIFKLNINSIFIFHIFFCNFICYHYIFPIM